MSADAEVVALGVVVDALADLPRSACRRVLRLAEDRFVSEPISELDPAFLTTFTESLRQAAAEIGGVTPKQLVEAASVIVAQSKDTADA